MKAASFKELDWRLKGLFIVLIGMALFSAAFGIKLIAGATLVAIGYESATTVDEGSRAFFMMVSGLGMMVFATGFVMMTRELRDNVLPKPIESA